MNVELREFLADRADGLEPPRVDPDLVVARGEQLVRRRRATALSAVAAAVAITLGLTALLVGGQGTRPEPAGPPDGVPGSPAGARPLSYGLGQTLHLGDRELDTGIDFLTIDLTDDGAALTTVDGGIWFTDGTTVERIGSTLGVCCVRNDGYSMPAGRPSEWVAGDSAGSLLAWLEFAERRLDQPELVVYDSSTRAVVAREPVDTTAANSATIVALADRAVFVSESVSGTVPEVSLRRFDLDTGSLEAATGQELSAAVRGVRRALAVGPVGDGLVVGAPKRTFGGPPMTETLDVVGSTIENLHDPRTREPVEIVVPRGFAGRGLWFTQWLDDDRFAATTYVGRPIGDLLVCRISAGRCHVVVDSADWRVDPLLPGPDNYGSELAQSRAVEDYRRGRG